MEHITKRKQEDRERIQSDTEQYLADGGKIEVIPSGQISTYQDKVAKELASRAAKANKASCQSRRINKHFNKTV